MNKYVLKTICFLSLGIHVIAQSKSDKDYKQRAAEIQQEIWGSADKAFEVKDIPEKYKNESAVIIAKSFEVANSSQKKFKMIHIWGGKVNQYRYFTTLRERVLIKDKSALDDYSTLNYNKIVDNTARIAFVKLINTYKTYIGARILKPDGKTSTFNPDEEEVLVKDNDKSKEGKIAIPDLQIGDIIDYYIRIEEVIEDQSKMRGPNFFFLNNEYPVLYYNVKYTLDKKCGADIMNMNGARPMNKSINDDRDVVIEFTEKDLPKVNNTTWTSLARQVPYYVVRYGFPGSGLVAKAGEVKSGPFTDIYKDMLKNIYQTARITDHSPEKGMETYFGRKKIKDQPVDSIVNYLYNYFRWQEYGGFNTTEIANDRNYYRMNDLYLAVIFSEYLKRVYDIENDIVVTVSRYSGRLNEVFGIRDFETFIRVTGGGKLTWLCFNDFFQNPGELSSSYQGEDAFTFTREGRGRRHDYTDLETPMKLPVMKSDQNVLKENLQVSFNKENFQLITVERTCSQTGAMKGNDQKDLLLAEDVQAQFAAAVKHRSAAIELRSYSTKVSNEVQAALDQERLKQKDYFKKEIKDQYDQEPKDLLDYKVISTGLTLDEPAFEYSETFTMDNFVKKAGNNYIFDAGRLMGIYKKTEEKERKRTLDIYMSCARTLVYNFSIAVPEGYTVKGVEDMNKKIENDIASYESLAMLKGNTVNITVTRTYKNNFEPAANWSKLLSVMDAAADFTGIKLLLEKNK